MYSNNFNGYYPNVYQQPIIQNNLKGRPVSSLEEVRAANIDFDGSLFIFPDIANKKIYTKQINLDGTSTLNQYELTTIPIVKENNADYITREEFEKTFAEFKKLFEVKKEEKEHKEEKANVPLF